jgi:hypothetical protein
MTECNPPVFHLPLPLPLPIAGLVQEKVGDILGHLAYFAVLLLLSLATVMICVVKIVQDRKEPDMEYSQYLLPVAWSVYNMVGPILFFCAACLKKTRTLEMAMSLLIVVGVTYNAMFQLCFRSTALLWLLPLVHSYFCGAILRSSCQSKLPQLADSAVCYSADLCFRTNAMLLHQAFDSCSGTAAQPLLTIANKPYGTVIAYFDGHICSLQPLRCHCRCTLAWPRPLLQQCGSSTASSPSASVAPSIHHHPLCHECAANSGSRFERAWDAALHNAGRSVAAA